MASPPVHGPLYGAAAARSHGPRGNAEQPIAWDYPGRPTSANGRWKPINQLPGHRAESAGRMRGLSRWALTLFVT